MEWRTFVGTQDRWVLLTEDTEGREGPLWVSQVEWKVLSVWELIVIRKRPVFTSLHFFDTHLLLHSRNWKLFYSVPVVSRLSQNNRTLESIGHLGMNFETSIVFLVRSGLLFWLDSHLQDPGLNFLSCKMVTIMFFLLASWDSNYMKGLYKSSSGIQRRGILWWKKKSEPDYLIIKNIHIFVFLYTPPTPLFFRGGQNCWNGLVS